MLGPAETLCSALPVRGRAAAHAQAAKRIFTKKPTKA